MDEEAGQLRTPALNTRRGWPRAGTTNGTAASVGEKEIWPRWAARGSLMDATELSLSHGMCSAPSRKASAFIVGEMT